MKRTIYRYWAIALLVAAGSFTACQTEKKQDDVSAKELINNPNTANNETGTIDVDAPALTFDELEYDFGKVTDGEVVVHRFRFKNTGKAPLVIQNAQASCGCTVPQWPSEPIAPNDTASIYVEFNSANRSGQQDKHVTITANTNPNTTMLRLKGEVLPILEKGPIKEE